MARFKRTRLPSTYAASALLMNAGDTPCAGVLLELRCCFIVGEIFGPHFSIQPTAGGHDRQGVFAPPLGLEELKGAVWIGFRAETDGGRTARG